MFAVCVGLRLGACHIGITRVIEKCGVRRDNWPVVRLPPSPAFRSLCRPPSCCIGPLAPRRDVLSALGRIEIKNHDGLKFPPSAPPWYHSDTGNGFMDIIWVGAHRHGVPAVELVFSRGSFFLTVSAICNNSRFCFCFRLQMHNNPVQHR